MAEIDIRPAISSDIQGLIKLDHSCETSYVWQLSSNISREQIETQLHRIKLPRSLKLSYPRQPELLLDTWIKHTLFLVARCEGALSGYLILDQINELKSARVSDLVVTPEFRRQGIASALVLSAQNWLKKRGVTRFQLEIPAKNHAGVELARKLQFQPNGYIDNYYIDQEMVLLFVNILK